MKRQQEPFRLDDWVLFFFFFSFLSLLFFPLIYFYYGEAGRGLNSEKPRRVKKGLQALKERGCRTTQQAQKGEEREWREEEVRERESSGSSGSIGGGREREREYVCRVYTLYERKGKRENRIGWEGREKEMERERERKERGREEERKLAVEVKRRKRERIELSTVHY